MDKKWANTNTKVEKVAKKQKTICTPSCHILQEETYVEGSCNDYLTDVVNGLWSNLMNPKASVSVSK